MKKLLGIFTTAVALTSLAATAQAQITDISVQHVTGSSPQIGTNTAGVVAVSGWNEDVNGASISNLLDSNGNGTGISLSTTDTFGTFANAYAFTAGSAGDAALFSAGALSAFTSPQIVTFTLSGLNPSDSYSLIAYTMSNTQSLVQGSLTGGATYYLINPTPSYSTYTQGLATTAGAAVTGDYFEFDNILGATSLTFTLTNQGGAFADLPGLQLIQTVSSAPEPSEALLVGIGLMGLVVLMRRKRLSSL